MKKTAILCAALLTMTSFGTVFAAPLDIEGAAGAHSVQVQVYGDGNVGQVAGGMIKDTLGWTEAKVDDVSATIFGNNNKSISVIGASVSQAGTPGLFNGGNLAFADDVSLTIFGSENKNALVLGATVSYTGNMNFAAVDDVSAKIFGGKNDLTAIGARVSGSGLGWNKATADDVAAFVTGDRNTIGALGAEISDAGFGNEARAADVTVLVGAPGQPRWVAHSDDNTVYVTGAKINQSGSFNLVDSDHVFVQSLNGHENKIGAQAATIYTSESNNKAFNDALTVTNFGSHNTISAVGAQISGSGSNNFAIAGSVSAAISGSSNTVTVIGSQISNAHK